MLDHDMLDIVTWARAAAQPVEAGCQAVRRRRAFALPFFQCPAPAGISLRGFAEDPPPPPSGRPLGGGQSLAGAPLAALSGSALARRFWTWTGASGRRYICSVFAAGECPAFAEAIVIAVGVDREGSRRALLIGDSGPRLRVEGARPWDWRGSAELEAIAADEVHVHLLCDSGPRRRAAIEDLALTCAGVGVPVIYPPG